MSHCLTRWAERVLDGLEDDPDYVLSKPLTRLLEVAAEKQKWGGVFDAFNCGVCHGRIASIAGLPFVRTTVGTGYMCCAKPTKNDQHTVAEVNVIWKQLSLATVLDDQNQDAWDAIQKLPAWQAMLRVEKFSLGRGNLWVRWDEATDGMLSDLVDAALQKAMKGRSAGSRTASTNHERTQAISPCGVHAGCIATKVAPERPARPP